MYETAHDKEKVYGHGGFLCSFRIFGIGFFSGEDALRAYPVFGILIPAVTCSIVGIVCGIFPLGKRNDRRLCWANSLPYAMLYLLMGFFGLPEAVLERKWGLFVWFGSAAITGGLAFVYFLTGMTLGRKRSHNQAPQTTPLRSESEH